MVGFVNSYPWLAWEKGFSCPFFQAEPKDWGISIIVIRGISNIIEYKVMMCNYFSYIATILVY